MTAAQVYDSVTNGGAHDFAEAVAIFDQDGPRRLIGGLAVNHYVEPVYTIDADIVLVSVNLDEDQAALTDPGFTVNRFPHSVNARKGRSSLVLQFTLEKRYQSFIDHTQMGDVLGCKVPLAGLEDLIQSKVWAWSDPNRHLSKRKKDELDLIRIAEAYPETRRHLPVEILSQLPESDDAA